MEFRRHKLRDGPANAPTSEGYLPAVTNSTNNARYREQMLGDLLTAKALGTIPCIVLGAYGVYMQHLLPWVRSWLPHQERTPWRLDYGDVLKARALLNSRGLPMELVLKILENAEYWPTRRFSTQQDRTVKVAATMFRSSAAGLCFDADVFHDPRVDSLRKGGEKIRIKAIEFHIQSRDQGWTSEPTRGTFSTSSWLEASILRGLDDYRTRLPPSCWLDSVFESPQSFQHHITPRGWQLARRPKFAEQGPQGGEGDLAWYLQGNRVATQGHAEEYDITWTQHTHVGNEGSGTGDGFLDELRDGDRLLIWARAKWPGWQCIVEHVDVTVYYGFS
ncbi:hypothetical protein E8E12_007714 [Didymella heteroderae]|uniref:Uncharacterized protein n=1 Tax=Didymella heteroderae TaxID=1769908 RepID=A0A9P5C6Z4_9PLEO|nr:hypothetical protein E8E12_007714 [Didymella heteroderae]